MRLPNWLKILWWVCLVGVLSYFLSERLPDLLTGKAAAADIAVFGVWTALLLAPLFSEVTFLGVTLKNEIEELKGSIAVQLCEIRADIRSAVDVRTTVSQTFNSTPPTDAQLPEIENQVKAAVSAALAEHGDKFVGTTDTLAVAEEISFLFNTRYHIESELRRIATGRKFDTTYRRAVPIHLLSRSLVDSGLLSPKLGDAIREVYSVCSPAIHGEPVSEAQFAFVKDVGHELISVLRSVQ